MIPAGGFDRVGGLGAESHRYALRATLAGDGTPGPIEIRIGRRLVGLLEPSSREGRELLRSLAVELVGPEGENYGHVALPDAWRRMGDRLEDHLGHPAGSPDDDWLRESLARLRALESSLEGS